VFGRDDPDFVGQFVRDFFEHGEAGRVDAVVIGQEHAGQFRCGYGHGG
jgi:hypothetical protein